MLSKTVIDICIWLGNLLLVNDSTTEFDVVVVCCQQLTKIKLQSILLSIIKSVESVHNHGVWFDYQ